MRQFVREIIKISSGAANGWTFIKGNAKSWRDARNRFPRGEKNLSKVEQGFGRVRVNPYTSAESISAEANFSIFRKGRGGGERGGRLVVEAHVRARSRVCRSISSVTSGPTTCRRADLSRAYNWTEAIY